MKFLKRLFGAGYSEPEPAADEIGMIGQPLEVMVIPAGATVNMTDERIRARLERIALAMPGLEQRMRDGDAAIAKKIEALEAERTILQARHVMRSA